MNRRDVMKLLGLSAGAAFESRAMWALSAQAGTAHGPAFEWLPLGQVKPTGWIRQQMLTDLHEGFAGHLDELCHEASSGIFTDHRNSAHSQNSVNIENNNWWNGETEGNWRNGQLMMAFLAEDPASMAKAKTFVDRILASQDTDGYLGVFAPDIRFTRAGELWTQACLFRGLLAYYEFTGDRRVFDAVRRAVDLTIGRFSQQSAPIPFDYTISGQGLSHDLMFSDVAEWLYAQTGDVRYRDFTVLLYETLSRDTPGADTSLSSLLKPDQPFVNHGANTFEALRVPIWLAVATGRQDFARASANALTKLLRYEELTGSDVSEEDIKDLAPDPSTTLYEYCATKEIQFSLQCALQKSGDAELADHVERIWFNAAQGARLPDGKAVSYLTFDNRLHCDGLAPDGARRETRNKYSPTHTDVAVCCNPNATQVSPLFVRGMWMRHTQGGLVAALYGPCTVTTQVNGKAVSIEEFTAYPFHYSVTFRVRTDSAVRFPIFLRNPAWSQNTEVSSAGAKIERMDGYWKVEKLWSGEDHIALTLKPEVRSTRSINGEYALQYGPLLFAQPVPATKTVVKTYPLPGFEDAYYRPTAQPDTLTFSRKRGAENFGFAAELRAEPEDISMPFADAPLVLSGSMKRATDGKELAVHLVPFGAAPTLRWLTFPAV